MFEDKFSANDSERKNLINAYINDGKSLTSKIESNEKNFCALRNFLPISSIPNVASGTRANFFGIAEDIIETNGNLFFAQFREKYASIYFWNGYEVSRTAVSYGLECSKIKIFPNEKRSSID